MRPDIACLGALVAEMRGGAVAFLIVLIFAAGLTIGTLIEVLREPEGATF